MYDLKDILEVVVYQPDYHYSETYLFASDEALIKWWKRFCSPDAKNLRVKWDRRANRGSLLNWTTPQLPYRSSLTKVKVKA